VKKGFAGVPTLKKINRGVQFGVLGGIGERRTGEENNPYHEIGGGIDQEGKRGTKY